MNQRDAFRRQASADRTAIANGNEKSARMQEILWSWIQAQLNRTANATMTLCCYVAKPPEAETRIVLQAACDHPNITLAVPYCDGPDLTLYRLDSLEHLGPSQFGLSEPRSQFRTAQLRVAPQDCTVFVVPGLAFDRQGQRLGYGKGFYDRLLGKVDETVPRIGYAYSRQIYPQLPPSQPWDIPMTRLLTDQGWLEVER